MKKPLLLFLVSAFTICCTSQKTLNKLNGGMSKSEVLKVLGAPETSSFDGKFIYMRYTLKKSALQSEKNAYFVRLLNDRVDGYGLMADLNKPEIDKNESTIKALTEDEAFLELKKNKDLLDRGIITKDEYEKLKKKLLEN